MKQGRSQEGTGGGGKTVKAQVPFIFTLSRVHRRFCCRSGGQGRLESTTSSFRLFPTFPFPLDVKFQITTCISRLSLSLFPRIVAPRSSRRSPPLAFRHWFSDDVSPVTYFTLQLLSFTFKHLFLLLYPLRLLLLVSSYFSFFFFHLNFNAFGSVLCLSFLSF